MLEWDCKIIIDVSLLQFMLPFADLRRVQRKREGEIGTCVCLFCTLGIKRRLEVLGSCE